MVAVPVSAALGEMRKMMMSGAWELVARLFIET